MVIVRTVVALAAAKQWTIYQINVHNAFLNGDLLKEVYMHVPEGCNSQGGGVLEGNNQSLLNQTRKDLQSQFKMKVLGLGGARPVGTPIGVNQKLTSEEYDRCIRGDEEHEDKLLKDPGGRFVTCYLVKFGDALISWKLKKQETVSRSSAEAEFRSMASCTAEITWLIGLFKELGVDVELHVKLKCDSKAAIQIAANPIFHERTKHIDIDYHFVRERITQEILRTEHVTTKEQLADLITKSLGKT
uniref:Reverse transcriptase Ty1/copia-type domain-containing protein n=1 Tax=Nicotiana tabacum TaxID=4097 RepID=A0A1S3Y356_TOBAC|nr:PREDICTED: uncharacterized protein LOC107771629 [Nicotiana tabacum]